jgi:hypothetical protein
MSNQAYAEYIEKQTQYFNSLSDEVLKDKFMGLTRQELRYLVVESIAQSVRSDLITEVWEQRDKGYFIKRKLDSKEDDPSNGCVTLTTASHPWDIKKQPLQFQFKQMLQVLFDPNLICVSGMREEMLNAIALEMALARDYEALGVILQYLKDKEPEKVNFYGDPDSILDQIDTIGSQMYQTTKRGIINRIACTQDTLKILRENRLFKYEESPTRREGIYLAGTLADIKVYVVPTDEALLKDGELLVFYKAPNEGLDISVAFRNDTEIMYDEETDDFCKKGAVLIVDDAPFIKKLINDENK